MLAKAQADLKKASEYVKKLLPRQQPKSILKKGHGRRKKSVHYFEQQDSDEEETARDSVKMSTLGDTTSGHLGYEATCMKLRRSVIMIIACNRLRKLSTRQSQTVMEED